MCVLERFLNFAIERLPAHLRAGRRSKDIKDARAVRPLRGTIRVHHIGALVPAPVARASDEGHVSRYFLRPAPGFADRAAFRAGLAAGRDGFAAGFGALEGLDGLEGFTAFFGFGSGAAFATA